MSNDKFLILIIIATMFLFTHCIVMADIANNLLKIKNNIEQLISKE